MSRYLYLENEVREGVREGCEGCESSRADRPFSAQAVCGHERVRRGCERGERGERAVSTPLSATAIRLQVSGPSFRRGSHPLRGYLRAR